MKLSQDFYGGSILPKLTYFNAFILLVLITILFTRSANSDEHRQLVFGGDVMLGRQINERIQKQGAASVWGDVVTVIQQADFSFVNLESVVAVGGEPFQPARVYSFRAAPSSAETLAYAGIDFVSIANNHAMDYGRQGLAETMATLEQYDIAYAGAGMNLADAKKMKFLESGGFKVAVIAGADHFVEYAASDTKAGINLVQVNASAKVVDEIREQVQQARNLGADLIVFSIHWGLNWREQPTPRFQRFARAVIDAGVDIFHGHSAHLFQGIEVYRGKPILYDTGDLLDDYIYYPEKRNDLQLLFRVHVSNRQMECLELLPIQIEHLQVNYADDYETGLIRQRIHKLSSPFGTRFSQRENNSLLINLDVGGCDLIQ